MICGGLETVKAPECAATTGEEKSRLKMKIIITAVGGILLLNSFAAAFGIDGPGEKTFIVLPMMGRVRNSVTYYRQGNPMRNQMDVFFYQKSGIIVHI